MSYAIQLHNFIDTYNVFTIPTKRIQEYLRKHRSLYKAALLANHLFRVTMMVCLLQVHPLGYTTICMWLIGSLFHRFTVENNSAYKFALPSFLGAMAFLHGKWALAAFIQGTAFSFKPILGTACISLLPLSAYFAYIALTVSYDGDHR